MRKIVIQTDTGRAVEATAPVIISASRSTDIPAFYAKWFFNRLAKGYCVWYNPFNRQKMYVSFARCKVIVFWTKNPKPILPYLHELDEQGIHYYFQVTLNDYTAEGFEPNVPSVEERIRTFRELSEKIGHERMIWRFDPLILTPDMTPRTLLSRIWKIGNQLKGYTDKLVFSFADIGAYTRVRNNLVKEAVPYREFDEQAMNELASGISRLNTDWKLQLATCAEAIPLEAYGIAHNKCIDDDLLIRLFPEDQALMDYLGVRIINPDLFHSERIIERQGTNRKDPGQREACQCIASKDIGEYNTCPHLCKYCYANASPERALRHWQQHLRNPHAETIRETSSNT